MAGVTAYLDAFLSKHTNSLSETVHPICIIFF